MYGKNGRIGLLVPSTNSTAEIELHDAVPAGMSIHTARCFLKDTGVSGEERVRGILEMNKDIISAARQVASVKPQVIAWACTAGSFLEGLGHDRRIIEEIETATGIPALTTSTAVVEALKALDVRRIAVATPYIEAIDKQEKLFLEQSVPWLQVHTIKGLGIVKAHDKCLLEPETAYNAACEIDSPDVDCIFISCTAWRTFEIIASLEMKLGKPVVTSNQATLWASLNLLGTSGIRGLGRLLQGDLTFASRRPRLLETG